MMMMNISPFSKNEFSVDATGKNEIKKIVTIAIHKTHIKNLYFTIP
jgi:hypothetical protein